MKHKIDHIMKKIDECNKALDAAKTPAEIASAVQMKTLYESVLIALEEQEELK